MQGAILRWVSGLFLALSVPVPRGSAQQASLHLKEISTIGITQESPIKGASLGLADERMVVWSDTEVSLPDSPGLAWRLDHGKILRAEFITNDRLQVVTTDPPRLITLHGSLTLIAKRDLRGPVSVLSVGYSGKSWFLFGLDELNVPVIWDEKGSPLIRLAGQAEAIDPANGGVHFSVFEEGEVFSTTQIAFPFQSYITGRRDGRTMRLAPPDSILAPLPPGTWASLPLLRLDLGYLQTLANMSSDDRVLLRYTESGDLAASSLIRVPMGFVASFPSLGLALAVKGIDGTEVSKYAWRWGRR